MKTRIFGAGIVLSVVLLSGCSVATPKTDAATPSATATASDAPKESTASALTKDQLSTIFTDTDFTPDSFPTTKDMFESIYPGVTVSAACEVLIGVRYEGLPALKDGALQFGPSIDRSMTAVIMSLASEKEAENAFQIIEMGIDACVTEPGVTFQGDPVEAKITRGSSDVAKIDQGETARMDVTVNGVQTHINSQVVRVGSNVIVVVGWDPKTNDTNVPLATSMFVNKVVAAK